MTYRPWIGCNFETGAFFGQRVLIMGESHYGSDDPETTITVVRNACNGMAGRFFTNLGSVFVGLVAYRASPDRFWNSVAFMNFIDWSVGATAKNRPTADLLTRSGANFRERLNAIAPDRVIVFSSLSWRYLPPFDSVSAPDGFTFDPRQPEIAWCGGYRLANGQTAWTMFAQHPSSRGWKPGQWRSLVASFLATPFPSPPTQPEPPAEEIPSRDD